MLVGARIESTGVLPTLVHKDPPERGTPQYPMTPEDLLEFGRSPRRWVNGKPSAPEETPPIEVLIRAQWLEKPATPHQLVARPLTYQSMRLTCPKCASSGPAKLCKKCNVARINQVHEAKWSSQVKYCKKWEQQQEAKGLVIIPTGRWQTAHDMVLALTQDPSIASLHEGAERLLLLSGTWQDPATGLEVPLRALLDWAPSTGHPLDNALGTLRAVTDASHAAWAISCYSSGAHLHAALRHHLYAAATKDPRPLHVWNLIERQEPYLVARRRAEPELMLAGTKLMEQLLAAYCVCLQTGLWPEFDAAGKLTTDDWSPVYLEEWLTQGTPDSARRYFALGTLAAPAATP